MSKDIEYQSLRNEILDNSNRQLNIVNLALGATVVLIGYGVDKSSSLTILAPLLLLALAQLQLVRSVYTILRIASYIRLFIESDDDNYNWETRIRHFRQRVPYQKHSIHVRHTLPSYGMGLFLTGVSCIILSITYAKNLEYIIIVATFVLWVWFSVIIFRWIKYETSDQLENDFDDVWKEVRKLNKQSNNESDENG